MHRKAFSLILALGAVLFLAFHNVRAETDFYPLEKLKPGLRGIGKTCFEGSTPEEFQVEILGVLHGMEPGASAVLARLESEALARVGVFEGMSGSPVRRIIGSAR